MSKKKITAHGLSISVVDKSAGRYISLTDMAKFKNSLETGIVIANWLSTKYTIQFMGAWEKLHNPDFNVMEFNNIKNEAGSHGFILSSSNWVKKTGAIGIRSTAGRYGGTYAHQDIAFEFATWLSPEFKIFLIKEFQRLKEEEAVRLASGWDVKRQLTKINYRIHTDAIKENLLPKVISSQLANVVYASEADILNVALFGQTAKQWRKDNPGKKGNIRDYCNVLQLIVLANLESFHAELIREQLSQPERLKRLNQAAIAQMTSLLNDKQILMLEADKK